jgi:hypothetical protein
MTIALTIVVLTLTAQVVLAAIVGWDKNKQAAPDRGEFLWNNNPGEVVWGPNILIWDQASINALKNLPFWADPTFEFEGYKPPDSKCDKVTVDWVYVDFPINGWSKKNGCGSGTQKELAEVYLYESSSSWQAGKQYTGLVFWDKVGGASGDGEMNFTYEESWSDDWLGKVAYNIAGNNYNASCSSPPNALPGVPGCP